MVARGDLGMEIPLQKVFYAQKYMIQKSNNAGVPVIVATQMMESIISNYNPTSAEISDIANSIFDGADAVMLSGETANGMYPVRAVQLMRRTAFEAETSKNYLHDLKQLSEESIEEHIKLNRKECISISTVQLSYQLNIKNIICITSSGKTPLFLTKYRPECNVIVVCQNKKIINQLMVNR